MRVHLLVNQASGKPRRRKEAMEAVIALRRDGASVTVVSPGSPEETRARAGEATTRHTDVLLVAGGDGTLNAVVNGLYQLRTSERPLVGVLPSGRGNDFAADVGIHSAADALEALRKGSTRRIDLARSEAGVFAGIAGTGFDAKVARFAQGIPILTGSALYSYAVIRALIHLRPIRARIEHDHGVFEGEITFAAVGNTRRYGGGMHITPRADLSDGLLDLCLVKEVTRRTLLRLFPTVFSGKHLELPQVEYLRSKSVTIATEEPGEVFADGEFLQETPVKVEVLPGQLEVLVKNR